MAIGSVIVAADIPGVAGLASLASRDLDYELESAAAAPDGRSLWFTANARRRGDAVGQPSLVLATMDAGNTVTQSPLALDAFGAGVDASAAPARRALIDSMVFDARGELMIAGGRAANGLAAMRVAGLRTAEAARRVPLSSSGFDLHRLARLANGRVFAFGVAGGKLTGVEVAENGRLVGEKALLASPAFVEMAASAFDGGAVVLARRGFEIATAEIWAAKLSSRGDVEQTITLPGRTGSIAALKGGGFALVSSRAGTRGFDVTLRVLGPDMRERSANQLVTDQVNPAFSVVATPSGGFVVAGSKDRGLWVSEFAPDGRPLWTEMRKPAPPDAEMVFNLQLASTNDTVFLPYTAFTLEGREQRKSVRIIKFQVK
jgi:hypothetical protein